MDIQEDVMQSGLIPSPVDPRDLSLEGIVSTIIRYPKSRPAPFDLDWRLQGTKPHCVGFAAASLNQQAKARQKVYTPFDGSWLYNQCKLIDGKPNLQGTYLRAGMQVLKNNGAMPVDGSNPENYKIEEFANVKINEEELRIALDQFGGVLAGFELSAKGWTGNGQEILPPAAGETTNGHAVMLTHYDEKYFYGVDSLKNYHGGQVFKFQLANYRPFEAWTITIDNKAVVADLTGFVAKEYIQDGVTTAKLNLRGNPGLSSGVVKVLPKGTKVKEYAESVEIVDNILWEYVEIL